MKKNKVLTSFIWRILERFGAQGVTLIVSFILARILDPSVYGTVALVTVITSLLQVFIDGGLGNSLIQKKDADEIDFSSVFFVNLTLGITFYSILFFIAPLVENYYQVEKFSIILRVLGSILIISSLKNVQQAYVSRHMIFKKFFFATLGGTVLAAIVGITMALNGFGVWALVIQLLVNNFVDTIVLWFTVGWRPKMVFSFKRVKKLLGFGWKLSVASLISSTFVQIKQLLVGKKYSKEDLAYYNYGEKIPSIIVTNINASFDSVLFPAMSNEQESVHRLKSITQKAISLCTFILVPFMILLFVCADSLVNLVLTEKWSFCVPFLRVFCVVYMFYPIHTANLNAINALGKSNIYLILEIIKTCIGIGAILIAVNYGPIYIAIAYMCSSIIAIFINSFPNRKLINYGPLRQLLDTLPNYILSLVVGVITFLLSFLIDSKIMLVLIQVVVFAGLYLLGAIITKNKNLKLSMTIIGSLFKKGEKND